MVTSWSQQETRQPKRRPHAGDFWRGSAKREDSHEESHTSAAEHEDSHEEVHTSAAEHEDSHEEVHTSAAEHEDSHEEVHTSAAEHDHDDHRTEDCTPVHRDHARQDGLTGVEFQGQTYQEGAALDLSLGVAALFGAHDFGLLLPEDGAFGGLKSVLSSNEWKVIQAAIFEELAVNSQIAFEIDRKDIIVGYHVDLNGLFSDLQKPLPLGVDWGLDLLVDFGGFAVDKNRDGIAESFFADEITAYAQVVRSIPGPGSVPAPVMTGRVDVELDSKTDILNPGAWSSLRVDEVDLSVSVQNPESLNSIRDFVDGALKGGGLTVGVEPWNTLIGQHIVNELMFPGAQFDALWPVAA